MSQNEEDLFRKRGDRPKHRRKAASIMDAAFLLDAFLSCIEGTKKGAMSIAPFDSLKIRA